MNIKSLLLGSAAALVAVSGARAADVIVPMEEPTNFVRVCDVYGTGFYYIPGTETCLSINGYVRYQISVAGPLEDRAGNDFVTNAEGDDFQAGSNVRVRLNFDVREETELGTLRAYARIQATNTFGAFSNDQPYGMDMGYIQLGGLTMGYLDSLWTEGDGLLTDSDLPVGDYQTNRISYTFAASGFSAAVSLEDDASGDFVPDVVGKIGYDAGFAMINVYGSYDERIRGGLLDVAGATFNPGSPVSVGPEFIDLNGNGVRDPGEPLVTTPATPGSFSATRGVADDPDGAFALKANISFVDLIAADSEFKIEGSYAFDPSSYSTIGIFDTVGTLGNPDLGIFVGTLPVEWQIGAAYAQSFGRLGVAVAGAYGETFDQFNFVTTGPNAGNRINEGNANYYKLVGNVGYEVTSNFAVLGEVSYTNLDVKGSSGFGSDTLDQTSGFLRFERSF